MVKCSCKKPECNTNIILDTGTPIMIVEKQNGGPETKTTIGIFLNKEGAAQIIKWMQEILDSDPECNT